MKPLSTGSTSNTNGDGTQQNNNDKLGEHLGSLASETPEYKIKKINRSHNKTKGKEEDISTRLNSLRNKTGNNGS